MAVELLAVVDTFVDCTFEVVVAVVEELFVVEFVAVALVVAAAAFEVVYGLFPET